MTDIFSKSKRREVMAKVKGKNTKPEVSVRQVLHRLGFRFRLHRKDLPGKPDIVLPKYKTVIFVNGCFWHGHGCKKGTTLPKTRAEWWKRKLDRNVERDKENIKRLQGVGWNILVV